MTRRGFGNIKMQIRRCDRDEIAELLWDWTEVKHFPGILCKELLRQEPHYFVAWATIASAEQFLSLMIRDQSVSRRLTPAGSNHEQHQLRSVIHRMNEHGWTFKSLAHGEELSQDGPGWFSKFNALADFNQEQMGLLAIHPRTGLKGIDGEYGEERTPASHEIYEGQHRALTLAWKMIIEDEPFRELRAIYLWPDRHTG